MILSDLAIQQALRDRELIIDPEPPLEHYNTSAVDLRLGESLKAWREDLINARGVDLRLWYDDIDFPTTMANFIQDAPLEAGAFILQPRQFALGQTLEKVGFPIAGRLAARVEGRSSLARLGVVVHLTAPTIHNDFGGEEGARITLEIINMGPFRIGLRPGRTRICQLIIERVEGEIGGDQQGQFRLQQDQIGGTGN